MWRQDTVGAHAQPGRRCLPRAGPTRWLGSRAMSSAPGLPALALRALVVLSACWCEAQGPSEARFRLATPTARPADAVPFPAGIPPELQLLVETFAPRSQTSNPLVRPRPAVCCLLAQEVGRPGLMLVRGRIPARCSFVGPPGDESALSGGIMVEVRSPPRAEQLAASLDRAAPGTGAGTAARGGDALIRSVLAQTAGMSDDAAHWRAVADAGYAQQLMQTLIVAGHRLGQAQRHHDSVLLLVLALQANAEHPAYQDALEQLGVALQYGSHLHCAEAMHARALARAGDRALPHLNLGLLKLHSARETEAQQHLERAIALACGHPSVAISVLCAPALQGLGSAQALLGRPRAARRLFLACARLAAHLAARAGPHVECYMSAAAVSQELGDLDEAIPYLVRALGLLQPPSLPLLPTPPDLAAFPLSLTVPLSSPLAGYLEDAPFSPAPTTTHLHTQRRWLASFMCVCVCV